MTNSSAPLLSLRDLSVYRDDRCVLQDVELSLSAGDVMQVVGPNGAGKTSLLRVVAGISRNYKGGFFYEGRSIHERRWEFESDILYLAHLPGIKKAMTPRENLRWYQEQTAAVGDIEEALAKVGLVGYEDVLAGHLSAGQLRRVALARLHISSARLWILDEPFTAIDKRGVAELEHLLSEHAKKGGAVLLTSHQDLTLPAMRVLDLNPFKPLNDEWFGDFTESGDNYE